MFVQRTRRIYDYACRGYVRGEKRCSSGVEGVSEGIMQGTQGKSQSSESPFSSSGFLSFKATSSLEAEKVIKGMALGVPAMLRGNKPNQNP